MVNWMDFSFKLKMADIHDDTGLGTAVAVRFEDRSDEIYFAVDFRLTKDNQIIVVLGDEIRDATFIFRESIDNDIFRRTDSDTQLLVEFDDGLHEVKDMSFDESDDIILTV